MYSVALIQMGFLLNLVVILHRENLNGSEVAPWAGEGVNPVNQTKKTMGLGSKNSERNKKESQQSRPPSGATLEKAKTSSTCLYFRRPDYLHVQRMTLKNTLNHTHMPQTQECSHFGQNILQFSQFPSAYFYLHLKLLIINRFFCLSDPPLSLRPPPILSTRRIKS